MPTRRVTGFPIARRAEALGQTSRFGAQPLGYGSIISRATTSNARSRPSLRPVDRRLGSNPTWHRYRRSIRQHVGRLASPRREAERILNGAARRLLAEQLERDAADTSTAGSNGGTLHGGTDQFAPLVEGQQVPVRRGVDSDGHRRAA